MQESCQFSICVIVQLLNEVAAARAGCNRKVPIHLERLPNQWLGKRAREKVPAAVVSRTLKRNKVN
jgi:hypothetical protein